MRTMRALVAAATTVALVGSASAGTVMNGSFETGDFTGWIVKDLTTPFEPLGVLSAGTATAFDGFGPMGNVVIPTDGDFAANTGFDGDGPGIISLSQDIGVVSAGEILEFDYRAGWDLASFGATLDRSFQLWIEPAGGGEPLAAFVLILAEAGTDSFGGANDDTGPLSSSFDLSPFAGEDVRINFVWTVPETFSGPANGQLDHVRIIPAPGALALLGIAGFAARRRRR